MFDRTFAITTAMQLVTTLVAFIGVLSSLLALQLEKAREIGILRALGLNLSEMRRLTFWETGLLGVSAGLLALPTGYILADPEQKTNVPGVYAAGDVTRLHSHQISAAVHEGGQAASAANYFLYPPELKDD